MLKNHAKNRGKESSKPRIGEKRAVTDSVALKHAGLTIFACTQIFLIFPTDYSLVLSFIIRILSYRGKAYTEALRNCYLILILKYLGMLENGRGFLGSSFGFAQKVGCQTPHSHKTFTEPKASAFMSRTQRMEFTCFWGCFREVFIIDSQVMVTKKSEHNPCTAGEVAETRNVDLFLWGI